MNKYKNLLIFDGSNLIHRQLSQPNMWELEYNGIKTGGVFGFMRSLLSTLQKFPHYYPVVVFDYGRSPRRLEIYPNYKHQADQDAERAEKKKQLESGQITFEESQDEYLNELIRQSNIIKDILLQFKIPVLQVSHWEGDDLMAILSRMCDSSVIITDDKDMYQLLTPTCEIFRAMRINSDGSKGEHVLYKDYEHPEYKSVRHLVHIKAIIGDGSDNIPGVAKGIGYKTAEKIADVIIKFDEDKDKILEYLRSDDAEGTKRIKNKFKEFADCYDKYLLNMQLVDLSVVPQDPIIVNKFDQIATELLKSSSIPNMIEIMKSLAANGITKFDFNRLIQLVSSTKQYALND